MAIVSIKLADPGQLPVVITIQATADEMMDYLRNISPSHAIAHRLSEAMGEALAQLKVSVVREVNKG